MPLFLPSDPDKFPTGELKKAVKPSPQKPDPKDTWVEVKPGIWENGLGQKKSDGLTKAYSKVVWSLVVQNETILY